MIQSSSKKSSKQSRVSNLSQRSKWWNYPSRGPSDLSKDLHLRRLRREAYIEFNGLHIPCERKGYLHTSTPLPTNNQTTSYTSQLLFGERLSIQQHLHGTRSCRFVRVTWWQHVHYISNTLYLSNEEVSFWTNDASIWWFCFEGIALGILVSVMAQASQSKTK